jgi:hypothetical protein
MIDPNTNDEQVEQLADEMEFDLPARADDTPDTCEVGCESCQ